MLHENYYALLIGINHYSDGRLPDLKFAEKDCQDLYSILTNEKISFFPEKNVKVLTGNQATTEKIKEYLYELRYRQPGDLVVIFFSGHGFFAGDEDNAYIGSYDVNIDHLKKNPDKGVGMEFIYDKIFMSTRADKVILLFDCCFSGSFINQGRLFFNNRNSFNDDTTAIGGRFAILSSLPFSMSREAENYQNGVFTHHLLNALRKNAADRITGEVTLPSLIDYLEQKMGGQISTFVHSTTGRIILAKPGAPLEVHTYNNPGKSRFEAVERVSHPLDHVSDIITDLMNGYKEGLSAYDETSIVKHVLEIVRKCAPADFACILEQDQSKWQQIPSEVDPKFKSPAEYFNWIQEPVLSALSSDEIHSQIGHGYFITPEPLASEDKCCLLIPLAFQECNKYLVLCGVRRDSPFLEDTVARVLSSFYHYSCEPAQHRSIPGQPLEVEAAIIDDLHKEFGFLPIATYIKRFELFKKRLNTIEAWYQPITAIYPQARFVKFDSWEALARDPQTGHVPKDLLDAAEVWGPEFQIELDCYCLYKSVKTYSEITLPAKGEAEFSRDILDLAVNVFPPSLMSPAFYETVNHVVNVEPRFPARKIVFEISEKRDLPTPSGCEAGLTKYDVFQNRIDNYVSDFGTNFAIDDFGVGHSSVSRLANLNLSHIKLDTEIARQDHSLITMSYVRKLVDARISSHSKVILEGLDSFKQLKQIYKLKIDLIQGYAVREARPDVTPIEDNLRKEIAACLD